MNQALAPDVCSLLTLARERRQGSVASALCSDADMEQLFIDSTIVRAHQHSAGAQKGRALGHRPLAGRTDYETACRCGMPWAIPLHDSLGLGRLPTSSRLRR